MTKIWALGADIRVCVGSEEHSIGGNRTRLIGSRRVAAVCCDAEARDEFSSDFIRR
jgi:hypothetical protein